MDSLMLMQDKKTGNYFITTKNSSSTKVVTKEQFEENFNGDENYLREYFEKLWKLKRGEV